VGDKQVNAMGLTARLALPEERL